MLKYQVTFCKAFDSRNKTKVDAQVTIRESAVGIHLFTREGEVNLFPRNPGGGEFAKALKQFDTPIEAETWAKGIVQELRQQYVSCLAGHEFLTLPEDIIEEFDPFAAGHGCPTSE